MENLNIYLMIELVTFFNYIFIIVLKILIGHHLYRQLL